MEDSITNDELLKFVLANDIIDANRICKEIEMKKRQEYLNLHEYDIWLGSNGYWYTYLPTKNGRVQKKRKNRESLENMLVEFYQEREENPYIETVFWMWVNEKLKYEEICKGSYDRYANDFKRFFGDARVAKKRLKSITEEDIEDFIKSNIKKFKLTKKTYSGLVILLKGIFKFAKKRKYTKISITEFLGDLELSKSIFSYKVKTKEDEVFKEDEVPRVAAFVKSNPTIWNLGVLLVFQTGLRVGELSTLKKVDIDEHTIFVRRTETKYKDDRTGKWTVGVKEYAKTEAGNRELFITSTAEETIKKIISLNPDGDFLFMNKGKRIRENTFNKRINSICIQLDIKQRPIHKARKTYGTTLIDGNVDDSIVAEQMGHSNIETTKKYYYYSNKREEKRREQISKATIV